MSEWIISFQGDDADQGHLQAFAGIESAAGIARALTMIAHYAATGSVRYRSPFDETIKFYLEGTEDGSFNWKLVASITGQLALGLSSSAIYDLSKLAMSKAIGEEPTSISQPVSNLNETKSGDIDALVEAIEPSLKKGHYGIGRTVQKIVIQESRSKKVVVTFDTASKGYLLDSIKSGSDVQDVAIPALNVNDRTGRAYFLDLKRTVPFSVSSDADPKTMSILSAGIDRYANELVAPIRITFLRIEATDRRLKRIIIFKAEDISDEQ